MKIVFVASLAGRKQLEENYRLIAALCRRHNHKVFDDYVFKYDVEYLAKGNIISLKRNYKKISYEIKKADALIAEVTQSSLGVGRFISLALEYRKPVLLLYSRYIPRAFVYDPTRLISLKKYFLSKPRELERKIINFIQKVNKKKLTYRFNLMLTKEMNEYLTVASSHKNLSKADYLRNLISEKMKKE
jgi:TPP-dependent 2-oxoacid decarboxylase